MNPPLRLSAEVAAALAEGIPVVALETAIVTHGLPPPRNLEAASACEAAIRARGALPATVAVIDGEIRLGIDMTELEALAGAAGVAKLGARDLATARLGATTVSGTLRAAALAGIRFMATGGIGGVHRDNPNDVSADLGELARSPAAVFCAGVKSFLDLPLTLERLESLGVPVLGFGCDELPAFYTRRSGLPVTRVNGADAVVEALRRAWALGCQGVVVAIPPPEELENAAEIVERALADVGGVGGPALTPAVLARVAELSQGRAVDVNVSLAVRNATVAAEVAAASGLT